MVTGESIQRNIRRVALAESHALYGVWLRIKLVFIFQVFIDVYIKYSINIVAQILGLLLLFKLCYRVCNMAYQLNSIFFKRTALIKLQKKHSQEVFFIYKIQALCWRLVQFYFSDYPKYGQ